MSIYSLSQVAAGTTQVAAAVDGKQHKVYCIVISLDNDGTWYFTDGVPLMGALKQDGQLQPVVIGPSVYPIQITRHGYPLSIVTTQAAKGFILYATEA